MTTYSSYEAAKIANPDSDIFTKAGKFIGECDLGPSPHTYEYRGIAKCKPADHCVTVERFLVDGNKFVDGDLILDEGVIWAVADKVNSGTYIYTVKSSNKPDIGDNERYILRAAALEEKKPRTKVEYVKCIYSHAWEIVKLSEEGVELFKTASNELQVEKINSIALRASSGYDFYRRIETPMTEREAFIEAACEITDWNIKKTMGMLFDSGKFKLVS